MEILIVIITVMEMTIEVATFNKITCQEEMGYYEKYGYGYAISCENLNRRTAEEFKKIIVYNEIKVSINNSDLLQVSSGLFGGVARIRELTVANSKIGAGLFEKLNRLQVLHLENNSLEVLADGFLKGLDSLKRLLINNNRLTDLSPPVLEHVPNLVELNLKDNEMVNLDKIPFCQIPHLSYLYLQNNRFKGSQVFPEGCTHSLRVIRLDHNGIRLLKGLGQNLVSVNFSHNKIEILENTFTGLYNLKEVSLGDNVIKRIKGGDFKDNLKLKKLDLKNNLIGSIEPRALNNLNFLEELNLSNNALKIIPVSDMINLKRLILSKNYLKIQNDDFRGLKSLQLLSLQDCNLKQLNGSYFQNLTSLEYLDLSNNQLTLSTFLFYGLHKLNEINLRNNSFIRLPDNIFQFIPNLHTLDLSYNKIKLLDNLIFFNLKYLENLNLSYNLLEGLSESLLQPLGNLRNLDLEGNRLKSIYYHLIISNHPNLNLINIRENRLSCNFLTGMLKYFKNKNIDYTLKGRLSYDGENVAGIGCKEKEDKDVLRNKMYVMKKKGGKNVTYMNQVIIFVTGLVILILAFFVSYRICKVVRRKNYLLDEIELLHT